MSFLTVPPEALTSLDPLRAVELCRRLLLSEARRQGIPRHLVNVTTEINAKDGGVDAEVVADVVIADGLLVTGRTSFQIKSGNFKNAQLREVVLTKDGNLHPRVHSCLKAGGKVVAFLPSFDTPDPHESAETKLGALVRESDHELVSPRIQVLHLNQVINLLHEHVQVALWLMNKDLSPFRRFDSWADERSMALPFVPDPAHSQMIENLRQALERPGAAHIRLVGDPGIGKTRMLLEALRTEDLAPLVLYTDRAGSVVGSEVLSSLGDSTFSGILVVDDCE